MTTLINPANGQRCEYVRTERGFVCLRTSCITPAVRWFSMAQMDAVNPVATCAEPPPIQGCELPPRDREIVVYMPDAMMVAINASSGIRFITRPAA